MLLNVNINYLANLRSSIGAEPDILTCARRCEHSGADGIILYISDDIKCLNNYDIKYIRKHLRTRFILKIPMLEKYRQLASDCKPDIVCLVPETNEPSPSTGVNVIRNQTEINNFMIHVMYEGSMSCVFIEPKLEQVNSAYKAGMHYVEFNTKNYIEAFKTGNCDKEYNDLKECTALANTLGMKVMIGKGLNYQNVTKIREIKGISDFNIGHSITTKAIFTGLDNAVREMKELVNER